MKTMIARARTERMPSFRMPDQWGLNSALISSPGLSSFSGYAMAAGYRSGGLDEAPHNEKVPREPWPKPQPSRDSRPSSVGPGTQLRMEFLPMAEAAGRCAIRRSRPPRLQEDLASRETRRSVTARRSRRIPVRSSDRPWRPRFPGGSRFPHHGLGAALTSPNLLIRAAAGFPRRRGWKRRPAPEGWQLQAVILFREERIGEAGDLRGGGEGPPLISRSSSPTIFGVLASVMEAAEELSLFHAGRAPIRPVIHVVDVAPLGSDLAAGPGAVAVTGDDGPSLGRGPDPGLATDVEDLGVRTEHDAAHRAVAGQHAEGVDVEDVAIERLMQPSGDPLQGGNVCDDTDMGLLATDHWRVAMIEPSPG